MRQEVFNINNSMQIENLNEKEKFLTMPKSLSYLSCGMSSMTLLRRQLMRTGRTGP